MTPENITPYIDLWPQLAGAKGTLVNLSENHTFRMDCANGAQFALRIHRPFYQDKAAIESELAWLAALGRDTALLLPTPVQGADGGFVQTHEGRHAVLFEFEPGREPLVDAALPALFAQLGEISATCHLHAQNWQRPENFTRHEWNVDTMLGTDGLWGDWRVAPNLSEHDIKTLERAGERLHAAFEAYGQTRQNFGLVHADMRLANLLVHDGTIRVIDFDDSGFGWFIYDFAAAVSFFETDPIVPVLWEHWCTGYQKVRSFEADDFAMLQPALLLRRMLLLAWIGSHGETELAQSHAPDFATGTLAMAEKFLAAK